MRRLIRFLVWLSALFIASAALAADCVESYRFPFVSDNVFDPNTGIWFSNVGDQLFVIQNDSIKMVIRHGAKELDLSCNRQHQLVAHDLGKRVFLYRDGDLKPLPLRFEGVVGYTDGDSVYSMVNSSDDGGQPYRLVYTRGGKSEYLALGYGMSHSGKLAYWTTGRGEAIYRDGRQIDFLSPPKGAARGEGMGYGDYRQCGTNDLLSGGMDKYVLRIGGRLQNLEIADAVWGVGLTDHCREFIVLFYDSPTKTGTLWSLRPGSDKPIFRTIKSPCSVESFSANPDGSIYYRCGNTFYYKNAARTEDRKLGAIPTNIAFDLPLKSRWLPTPDHGVLFSYTESYEPGHKQHACFARLQKDRMVSIGCPEVRK